MRAARGTPKIMTRSFREIILEVPDEPACVTYLGKQAQVKFSFGAACTATPNHDEI